MKRLIAVFCTMLFFFSTGVALAKGDTLIVANPSDAKSLDPHVTMESSSNIAMRQIYESLVMLDENGEIAPMMAEKWEELPNGEGYKFYLRQGVKFHNGEIMTADDVVFTFQRATGPTSAVKSLSHYINTDGIEKVDDHTVILRTSQPMGTAFLVSMNHPWASILNKKAVEEAGKNYGMNPVGTGRFKFASWAKGDNITFERFDDYYTEKAPLKRLIIRTVVEASSRTIELESGAVDVAQDLAPVDIKRVEEDKNLRLVYQPGQRLYHLGFDVTTPPYDDVRVREAMNIAINRPGIVKAIYKGYGEVATGPFSSAVLYNKAEKTPPFPLDVKKAKELLAEAGHPNGFSGEIYCPDRGDFMGIAQILQENFSHIGIKMDIRIFEWGAYIDAIKNQGHPPYIMNWWGGAPALDPFFFTVPPFHSKSSNISNRFYYKNPDLDGLLDNGVALNNGPEREEVYGQIWDILNRDLPWLSLVAPPLTRGVVKELKGVNFTPSFIVYYGQAYFE